MFTSVSATEVSIDKIGEIPGIYPRFKVDNKRIELFYEQMQCGQEFPPINIVKDESNRGCYILLGGKHRLEACRRLGKRKIKAFRMAVEKRHWRLIAAALNGRSSKPLEGEELKKVIQDAYEIDGIRDTEEIAHKLNCTVQYVRKILKPVRDTEKEKLKEEVVQLREEGLSLKNIGNKTGKPKPTIQSILKAYEKETVSFSYGTKPEKIVSNSEETPPNPCVFTAESETSNENYSTPDELPASNSSDQSKSEFTEKEMPTGRLSETKHVSKPDTPNQTDNPQKDVNSPLESAVGYGYRHKPDETSNNDCFLKEPRSIIPELERLDQKKLARNGTSAQTNQPCLTLSEKQALRAMELAGAGWNVEQIGKRLDRTEQFVRNVAASVIALFQNQSSKHPLAGRSHEEIAERLEMDPSVVEFIDEIVTHLPGVIPERKNIWWWLRENFPKYRSGAVERGSLIDIVRYETIYWKAIADNMLPSWEEEKEQMKPLEELPQDIEKRFLNYMDLIDELIDIANKGGFKADKITQAVLQRCNMVVTIQNKLRGKLGQWNLLAEDNKNRESTG